MREAGEKKGGMGRTEDCPLRPVCSTAIIIQILRGHLRLAILCLPHPLTSLQNSQLLQEAVVTRLHEVHRELCIGILRSAVASLVDEQVWCCGAHGRIDEFECSERQANIMADIILIVTGLLVRTDTACTTARHRG